VISEGPTRLPTIVGRYELGDEIGAGGMATVHFGRVLGHAGFTRPVAIKRLHPHLARDPAFVAAFVEEARLAARIFHPNVIATIDVISTDGELLLVMEYVAGRSLSELLRAGQDRRENLPIAGVVAVMTDVLAGLHAIHEATDEAGVRLGLVHRDISPQNVMVGLDGRSRVLDFGIAKATERRARERTRTGVIKGKLGYLSPEQFDGKVTPRSDIYAAAVVIWEALAGRRLFEGETDGEIIHRVLSGAIEPPSRYRADVPRVLDDVVLRALNMDPAARFGSGQEMAGALQECTARASASEVAEWVRREGAGDASCTSRSNRSSSVDEIDRQPVGVPVSEPSRLRAVDEPRSRSVGAGRGLPLVVAVGGIIAGLVGARLVVHSHAPAAASTARPTPQSVAVAPEQNPPPTGPIPRLEDAPVAETTASAGTKTLPLSASMASAAGRRASLAPRAQSSSTQRSKILSVLDTRQ
jgi:serine/threonine-protein kinase